MRQITNCIRILICFMCICRTGYCESPDTAEETTKPSNALDSQMLGLRPSGWDPGMTKARSGKSSRAPYKSIAID